MRPYALSTLALFMFAAVPALAQEQPPARVGRVSFVSGQLAFHTQGETTWSAAAVNYPVATGGSFWVDPKSRAEIRIGAQTIGLAGNTEIDIVKLDEQVMQLSVPQGRVELHVRQLGEGNTVEVDIPRGGVWLLQPGVYDIDAGNAQQAARIAAIDGRARFVGGTLDVAIHPGDAAVISGSETLTASLEHVKSDDFAEWCRSRDYHENRLASPYYVSPRMTGYEELDAYGSWRSVPEYGEVWYPSGVAAGWTPYSDGNWVWVAPWGWNWVGAEPWGFAPFHYGRWAYAGGAWGWVPGAFIAAPVYAPALVAFVANPTFILASAIAGPAVGWFPLGPGEAYWPSYSNDPTYIRALNTGAVRDPAHLGPRPAGGVATAGMNFANRNATTVVSQRTFASARGVAANSLRVSGAAAQHARVTAQGPAVRAAGARGGNAAAGIRGGGSGALAQTGRGGRGLAATGQRFAGRGAAAAHGMSSHMARSSFHGGHAGHHGGGYAAYHGGGRAGHGGGYAAFHGGGPHGGGGGPHFSGGGMPHFGGGGPHAGGGGGGPHGGGGGGGGAHGGGDRSHGGGGGGGGHGGGKGHG